MFFRRRPADSEDPWLETKIRLFMLGALLALLGMALESSWLIGGAALLLLCGLLLRWVPHPGRSGSSEQGDGPS